MSSKLLYLFLIIKINLKIFIALVLSVFLYGCTADDMCLSNQNALHANFFSMEEPQKTIAVEKITVLGLGMPEDYTVYKDETVSKMFLKLSYTADTTTYVIIKQTLKDTLQFVHSKTLDFTSRKCGFNFNFKLDTVLFAGIFIDSIAIKHQTVKYNENFDNVEIYIY